MAAGVWFGMFMWTSLSVGKPRHHTWPKQYLGGLEHVRVCPNDPIAPLDARRRLRMHHDQLVSSCGYSSRGGSGDPWSATELHTYEDETWPKPRRCAGFLHGDAPPSIMLDVPRAFLRAPDNTFGLLLVWKAGVSTARHVWRCAFQQSPVETTLRKPRAWVGGCRDPLSRLISAYGEILRRVTSPMRSVTQNAVIRLPDGIDLHLLRASTNTTAYSEWRSFRAKLEAQAGMPLRRLDQLDRRLIFSPRMPPPAELEHPSPEALRVVVDHVRKSPSTSWLYAGFKGTLPTSFGGSSWDNITRVEGTLDESARFRAFLRALECVPKYFAWQHAATQSRFLSRLPSGHSRDSSPAMSPSVSSLVRQEFFELDLRRELQRANLTLGHCRIKRSNLSALPGAPGSGAKKKPIQSSKATAADLARMGFPEYSLLKAVLEADDSLVVAICNIFMQDYLCLGYPLPPACQRSVCGAFQPGALS